MKKKSNRKLAQISSITGYKFVSMKVLHHCPLYSVICYNLLSVYLISQRHNIWNKRFQYFLIRINKAKAFLYQEKVSIKG
jgi:hypothetical protein